MSQTNLWILNDPTAAYLKMLDALPDAAHIVAGRTPEAFAGAPAPDAVMCGMGQGQLLEALWRRIREAKWVHSLAAGLENVLFPELAESAVVMTNSKGVFGRSLAEFAIAAALYFAKDFRRMIRSQQAGVWDPYDVDELTGKTFGVIGYGGIGREAARRAKALDMKVIAMRRNPGRREDRLLDAVFGPEDVAGFLSKCDYALVATPNTPETLGMIGERELRAMKSTAVLINVGRGPVIVEAALAAALEQGWIRGAALDVFDEEPLPEGHIFYRLENVLLSPHCADHTPGWVEEAMQVFVENFGRFSRGEPLLNVVDKQAGY
jgi:phosphoglycerate dehydrogenase-like enzyme